ncbi:hypothetical protein TWF970_001624 [Orbilia oligospora]|uniref:Uncharacterized protein n=1 Tax=Orbilia oligospora TaxID=2813651 RepID=A0A7C8V761_ORBOL|nr:hypothetical protein TWF970_001624 [Orbilia oligospora]
MNYFEVYARTGAGNDVGQVIETDLTTFDRFLSDLKVKSKDIKGLVHNSEITPWMKKSGFWDHMIGFDLKTIQEVMLLPKDYKLRGTGSEGSELEAAHNRVFRVLSGNPSTGEFDTNNDEIYRKLDDLIAEMCMFFVTHLILSNVFENVMLSFYTALCIGRTDESSM